METRKAGMSPGNRLETGAAILAAARVVDTELVTPRLTKFTAAHRSYVAAQRKVEAVEAQVREAQAGVLRSDAEQDEAVEALARALVAEGQPRTNPFAAFGAAAPSAVKKLTVAEEAKAIHQLVAAVQRSKTVNQVTRDAAQAAEQAARAMEAALLPMDSLEVALRNARHERDAVGQTWETTLAALRRGARSAADDGAPGLYTALFGRVNRPTTKKAKPAPAAPIANPA